MDKIVSAVGGGLPSQVGRNDDDMADRLSYRYTSLLLIFFALMTSSSQYMGNPIKCWVPAHFTDSQVEYTNSYCWIKSTYYLDFDEYIPYEHEGDGSKRMISYYQWVPMILLVQALFFYLPCMVWRHLNSRAGINVHGIVETSEELQQGTDDKEQRETLAKIAMQARRYFDNISRYMEVVGGDGPNSLKKPMCFSMRPKSGNYLVFLYLFVKILYFANIMGQMFLMDKVLGSNYHLYGLEVMAAWFQSKDWRMPERFPRATMCDLKVRRLGNVQRYTVQCVLPVNLFNEMIFLLVWWVLAFLAAYTLYSLLWWVVWLSMSGEDKRFVMKHLQYRRKNPKQMNGQMDRFIKALRKDGIFVMRLIGLNTDAVTVTDIVCALWDTYNPPKHLPDTPETPETLPLSEAPTLKKRGSETQGATGP